MDRDHRADAIRVIILLQRFDESFDLFFSRDQFTTTITKPRDASEPQADTGNDLADMLLNNDREGLAAADRAAAASGASW